jgi:putative methyltransferase (TIGR04325 family)
MSTEASSRSARGAVRSFVPPIVWDGLRRVKDSLPGGEKPQWEYVPEGWARAQKDPDVKGWNVEALAERHRKLWPLWSSALEGNGMLGVDFWRPMRSLDGEGQPVFTDYPWAHNAAMSFGYVIARSSHDKGTLSVLDFGGGVGQFAPLARALLPEVELEYHVAETPTLCSLGRELNPGVQFHDSSEDDWHGRKYDLAIASGALQCTEHWQTNFARLASVANDFVFVTRIPIVFHHPSFVVLQRAESYGLGTEFLGWFVNRDELLECAQAADLSLEREFVMMDYTPAEGAPEQATYRGFLFRPPGTA